MKTKKTLALCLLLALLAACSTAKPPQPQIPQPEANAHDDSIVFAIESDPTTLHPYDHAAVVSSYMNQLTYNRLFTIDRVTLEPVPELVVSFNNTDDVTWQFELRQGVLFHNGAEMKAEDVKASMEYARQFTPSSRYTGFWESVEVTGDYTFTIITKTRYGQTLYDLAANSAIIVPKALIEAGNNFNENPIGSGPYIYQSRILGDSVSFIKNENYYDKEHMPSITNMTWRVIPEGASRTIALESGEVDVVIDVEAMDVQRLIDKPEVEVIQKPGSRINFMAMNTEKLPFSNPLFRQAVVAAVDKEAVLTVAANGLGAISLSPNPEVFVGSSAEGAQGYDLEKAKELLLQSGISPADASFTLTCYTDITKRTAEVVQASLLELGIDVKIESMDFSAFLSNMLEGSFEASIAGYSSSSMPAYMKGLWHSSSIGASNCARLRSAEMDAAIDALLAETDGATRLQMVGDICRVTNELNLILPLYTSAVIRAYDGRLQGMNVSSSGLTHYNELFWAE